jgi:DNA polymerase III epsilon subunit-like protein
MATIKQNIPKYILCLDSETSGTDFTQNPQKQFQAISWGFVIFETTTFNIVDTLYLEVKFNDKKYKWSAEAEAVHGLTREHLSKHGISETEAIEEIFNFLMKYFDLERSIEVLGHNVWFDIKFLQGLLEPHGMSLNISQRYFDSSAIGTLLLGISRSDTLFDFLGLPTRSAHNALEDAVMTVMALQNLKAIVDYALSQSN